MENAKQKDILRKQLVLHILEMLEKQGVIEPEELNVMKCIVYFE